MKKKCNNCKWFDVEGEIELFDDEERIPKRLAVEGWCMAPVPSWADDGVNVIAIADNLAKTCPCYKKNK